jgi:hypothetical protein
MNIEYQKAESKMTMQKSKRNEDREAREIPVTCSSPTGAERKRYEGGSL